MLLLLLLALLLVPSGKLQAQSRPLDIYWFVLGPRKNTNAICQ